jgi:chemotaxis protein CheC
MLNEQQLKALTIVFRHGEDEASAALSKWLGRPARISVEQVQQLPLAEATAVLGSPDAPICACAMAMYGRITGELILVCDDASGLALADLLLGNPVGTATAWGEMEQSAALETTNIIGCAYLNALVHFFQANEGAPSELVPSPPRFVRDFAESLLQFALMNQAMASDMVFLTRTEFRIKAAPVNWNLLFVPDSDSLAALRQMLADGA